MVVEECSGLDTNIEDCGILELTNSGVLDNRTDKIMATAHGGSMYVEVNQFGGILNPASARTGL